MKESKLVTEDTTFVYSYNRFEYNVNKMYQIQLKLLNRPVNIHCLDSLFRASLLMADIPVKGTMIEYYDKDKDEIRRSSQLEKEFFSQWHETDMAYVDILKSIGIKAYVLTPYLTIFRKMALQLTFSIILIIATTICLLRLSKTIFRQWKEEKIKRDFVNTMIHELKRPIDLSVLMLEYLSDQVREGNLSKLNELLANAVFTLKKFYLYIGKIQDIACGETAQIELSSEIIPLQSFFMKLKEKYEVSTEKTITVNLQVEKELSLQTDLLHFSNIMENLMENAIKYSGKSVVIDIAAFHKNGGIRIIVRDNGLGIAPSEIHHVFDSFYRGKSIVKRRKTGFGLGLSYVKTMMQQMRGDVSVTSEENKYTEFTLVFS